MDSSRIVDELLDVSGMSKSQMSERSGVSRSLIDDYLKGRRQPSVVQLSRLGEAAGFDLQFQWHEQRPKIPRWARPQAAMVAGPLTLHERAQILERVTAAGMALPRRPKGKLAFPPFRTFTKIGRTA